MFQLKGDGGSNKIYKLNVLFIFKKTNACTRIWHEICDRKMMFSIGKLFKRIYTFPNSCIQS